MWAQIFCSYYKNKFDSGQNSSNFGQINFDEANASIRIPAGHPEGYLEAFAQIYSDVADIIQKKGNYLDLLKLIPNVNDGLHIMKFIKASVDSSNKNSNWVDLSTIK